MASFLAYRAVRGLRKQCRGWREVAAEIGAMSASYWHHVAKRTLKPSREAEDALRRRLQMPPKHFRRIERIPVDVLARMIQERR